MYILEKIQSSFFLLVSVYIIFLALGAMIFQRFEAPLEQQLIEDYRKLRSTFLKQHECVSDQDFEDLIGVVTTHSNIEAMFVKNDSYDPNWTFAQSFLFSSTIVTTIGYGHVTPLTKGGKMICIIYALIGIPITTAFLSTLVELMLVPTIWMQHYLHFYLRNLFHHMKIRILHIVIVVFILVVVFLFLPAAVFHTLESNWSFLDGLYYSFISLSTIGLGDCIPGDGEDQKNPSLYKILTTAYLLLGIAFLMLSQAALFDIPQINLDTLHDLQKKFEQIPKKDLEEGMKDLPGHIEVLHPDEFD